MSGFRTQTMEINGQAFLDGKRFEIIPEDPGYGVTLDGRIWTRIIPGPTRNGSNPFYKGWTELKTYKSATGYMYVKPRGIQRYIHRLVALSFIPNPGNKPQVNHIDGQKTNNWIYNLEWVLPRENQLHASKTGLMAHGENHGCHVLTLDNVTEIRRLWACGNSTSRDIGKLFCVSKTTVLSIVKGKTWAAGF